jgi:formiminoglutamase
VGQIKELIFDYFSEEHESENPVRSFPAGTLGQSILKQAQLIQKDSTKFNIAIIGIPDNRDTLAVHSDLAPDFVREQLYRLYKPQNDLKIADLGNLIPGKTVSDTYFSIKTVCSVLFNLKIIPILIGGGQNQSYGQFLAYQDFTFPINLTSIDSRIDIQFSEKLKSDNYLNKIISDHGKHLFNYTCLGIQRYLVSQKETDLMNKLFFDTIRLGEIRSNIRLTEPYFRDTDMLTIDMASVRYADSPGSAAVNPNGLTADEICQLCWYAGFSKRIKSIGIYEIDSFNDPYQLTPKLAAQMIWHFLDAQGNYKAIAKQNQHALERYDLEVALLHDKVVFRHDEAIDQWWIELPYKENDKDLFLQLACSEEDYKQALKGDIPDRIWKIYQKIN